MVETILGIIVITLIVIGVGSIGFMGGGRSSRQGRIHRPWIEGWIISPIFGIRKDHDSHDRGRNGHDGGSGNGGGGFDDGGGPG